MTPPSALVNTYVRVSDKPFIDVVSKIFVISGLPFGIIRLPILGLNVVFTLLSVIYSLILACFYSFLLYKFLERTLFKIIIPVAYVQCIFYIMFNLISIKRVQRYYNELSVFDKEVGCRPKIVTGTIKNIILTVAVLIYVGATFAVFFGNWLSLYNGLVLFVLSYVLEVHYCGHLLSLLTPRLRLINYYMELSLSNNKIIKTPNIEDFGYLKGDSNKALCKMEKVMNLYHNMIKAYNYLIEAVKWQLLVSIIVTFITILTCSYHVSLDFIKNDVSISYVFKFTTLTAGLMIPLFAPCILGDEVHNEVRRLRELLASRLYENQLDKSSRGMARALLAWTETRDLSFSLLRMLDIDISLPFKFVGLLVTYLIILLQFQKVINP